MPDPVARSLALARSAPTQSSIVGLTCVGLYSGIGAFEREVTALRGCIRAIGEWSAASRAIGRLDIGEVEYFSDVLSTDHLHVDPVGVEGAVITASCVDYSSAGAQAGLNGTRGWQVVDAPRTLLHFRDLLVSLVENTWGFTEANDGKSFAFYRTAMQRLHHKVYDPQRLNSRHLGMAI
jgi:site-specific DNA-cytosine methylase